MLEFPDDVGDETRVLPEWVKAGLDAELFHHHNGRSCDRSACSDRVRLVLEAVVPLVSDDILQADAEFVVQLQNAHRAELAAERARIAAQVREDGKRMSRMKVGTWKWALIGPVVTSTYEWIADLIERGDT